MIKKILLFLILCLVAVGLTACEANPDMLSGEATRVGDEEFLVLALQTNTIVVKLEEREVLSGYMTVEGGENDIRVYVKDDFGNTTVNIGEISRTFHFSFLALASGFYTIYFDNSESVSVNKKIKLHYAVR